MILQILDASNRVVFLNQIAGRAIKELQKDKDHAMIMDLCTNEMDGAFQCSYLGPCYLIPPNWRFPFQIESTYILLTTDKFGDVD
jgi:hypothetical protein